MMNFNSFIEWAFYAILTGASIIIYNKVTKIGDNVDEIKLNVKGVMVTQETHTRDIDRIDTRVTRIEIEQL